MHQAPYAMHRIRAIPERNEDRLAAQPESSQQRPWPLLVFPSHGTWRLVLRVLFRNLTEVSRRGETMGRLGLHLQRTPRWIGAVRG